MTKYRKSILTGAVGLRLRDLVREICRTNEIEILQGAVSGDHVHVLLSCPPNLSPSKIMQYIKGKTFAKADDGVQAYPKTVSGVATCGHVGYFVATSGNVTDEVIMEYISHQDGTGTRRRRRQFSSY